MQNIKLLWDKGDSRGVFRERKGTINFRLKHLLLGGRETRVLSCSPAPLGDGKGPGQITSWA